MALLFSFLLSICVADPDTSTGEGGTSNANYGCETVLQSYVFLSGVTVDETNVVVCDYKGNRIVRIDRGKPETIVDRVKAPVDVECVGGEYWILLNPSKADNSPKCIVSWNPKTKERKVLFQDFEEDSNLTAFAVASPNLVYVVDFIGLVYQIDLIKQTKSVVADGLDNPADIALLPGGGFVVTEQIGDDSLGGLVHYFLPGGREIFYKLIDPTGLAVGAGGDLYITAFFTESELPPGGKYDAAGREYVQGGVYRIQNENSRPELIFAGLAGPTSLAILPNGDLIVIEESNNCIIQLYDNVKYFPLFQGTLYPLSTRIFLSNGTTAYLTYNDARYELYFFPKGGAETLIWASSGASAYTPLMELGGDGLLYLYDPVFYEILLYDASGKLVNSFRTVIGANNKTQLYSDPRGGIALAAWTSGGIVTQRVNRDKIGDPIEYNGDYFSILYIDENGAFQTIKQPDPVDVVDSSGGQLAVNNNGDIWYVDPATGDVYNRTNNTLELVAKGLGPIKDISSDGERGVNVTTEDGRVYHYYPKTSEPPSSVFDWIAY